ncbi:Protein of unknown function [Pyronema omphalodes CBS 100304]|uniref:Uncharacterized protein n=1 Tax=Pyronema omphalodes (strain CBS 100304) TaxID=1076935 RepID=U4LQE2_PYROM|nr:Protein of unknown function [Pyronema omphalodes CBS 100304]
MEYTKATKRGHMRKMGSMRAVRRNPASMERWTREAWEFSSSKIYTEDSGAGSYFGEDGAGEGYFADYYQEFSEGELRAPEEEEKEGEEAGRGSAEEEEGPDEEEEEEEDEEEYQGWLYEEVDEKYDYRRMEEGEDEEVNPSYPSIPSLNANVYSGISRPTTPEVVEITNTDPVEDPIEAPIEITKNNNTRRTTSPCPPADSLHPPTTTKRRISESPSPSFGDLPSSPPTKRLKLETTPDEATFSGACTQAENQS